MVSATEAETVDRPATGPEIVALNASVVAKMRARALGASVPIPSAARAPRNGERRPLGLAPIGDDDDKAAAAPVFAPGPSIPSVATGMSAETLARAATMADVAEGVDAAVAIIGDGEALLRARIAELRGQVTGLETELARLRAQFAEAKAEFGEAKHILERLQVTREGKRGERGPCGADGAPGPRGEKGEKGDRGKPSPTIAAWEPDPDAFSITPRYSNGSTGVPANLLALFQAYHNAVSHLEDADLVEAAHASRAQADAEAEAAAR